MTSFDEARAAVAAGTPVVVPDTEELVARGAAVQAAAYVGAVR